MAKKYKTGKPTGVTISRKGNKFTVRWKSGNSKGYGWQRISVRYWYKKKYRTLFTSGKISGSKRTYEFTLPYSKFHPNKGKPYTSTIAIYIWGKGKDYTKKKVKYIGRTSGKTKKKFSVSVPYSPSIKVSVSEDNKNVSNVSWTNDHFDSTNGRIAVDTEYQTLWIKNGASKPNWKDAKSSIVSKTGNRSYTEPTAGLANISYTRWVRIRNRGISSNGSWVTAKHVYAKPNIPTIIEHSAEVINGGIRTSISWSVSKSDNFPIDTSWIEYVVATPVTNLECPDDASWNSSQIYRSTPSPIEIATDKPIGEDSVMFSRVAVKHDENITYSNPVISKYGKLKAPVISKLETNIEDGVLTANITISHESAVLDSEVEILYKSKSDLTDKVVGTISRPLTTATISIPIGNTAEDYEFGARNARKGFTSSDIIWHGGLLPKPPTGVRAYPGNEKGTIIVEWNKEENSKVIGAQISWAESPSAWESNQEPEKYDVSNIYQGKWVLSGLETGKRWYIRLRTKANTEEGIYGPWSNVIEVDLSAMPVTPTLNLSASVIHIDDEFIATWGYISQDGTGQKSSEICEVMVEENGMKLVTDTEGKPIILATTESSQNAVLTVTKINEIYAANNMNDKIWTLGSTHNLVMRVQSMSGRMSDGWSNSKAITVMTPITATIESTSLIDKEDIGKTLTDMPLTVTVKGAGGGGRTSLVIKRAEDYFLRRPDESKYGGYKGEVAFIHNQTGEDAIEINQENLFQILDDGAKYELVATVEDEYGQIDNAKIDFVVAWTIQATKPTATVEYDKKQFIAKITPHLAENAESCKCDIYRLSVDKPELIIEDGTFETTYVDPYPSFNETGGYRVVTKTINGDFITAENDLAYIDTTDEDNCIKSQRMLIDFDGQQIELKYNIELGNTWKKDFERTTYLGGAVVGEWNLAVTRDLDISSEAIVVYNLDMSTVEKMRRLAVYSGICHIRTPDGSSFDCNIDVTENQGYNSDSASYRLKVLAIDEEELNGMTLKEWEEDNAVE